MAVNRILSAGYVNPDALVQIITELLHLINGESEAVHEIIVSHYSFQDTLVVRVEEIINGCGGYTDYRVVDNQLVKYCEVTTL